MGARVVGRRSLRRRDLFEHGLRGAIAEDPMEPLAMVKDVDIGKGRVLGFVPGGPPVLIAEFFLE
jgi:hypothetical protein